MDKLSVQLIRKITNLLAFLSLGNLPSFVAVAAIIESDDYLLLLDRSDGLGLCLPGGLVKWREKPEQALIREVAEETGYEVSISDLFSVYSEPESDPRLSCVVLIYRASITGGYSRSSSEGEIVWHPMSDLLCNLAFQQEIVLEDYFANRVVLD
jgi:ADP-ribose pyrophosphatase YjhB (NUDIX family)